MRPIDLPACGPGHGAPLTHVGFRPDGQRLASCSYDGTVIVWDTGDPSRPAVLARLRHRRLVNACAWNPVDGEVLATASADKTVAVWRVGEEGGAVLQTVLARHTDDINSVAWLPDGKRLICVSEDGRATLWSAADGAFLCEVGSHEAHCMMVSVSAQGLVATVGEDGLVAVSDPDGRGAPVTRRYGSSIEGCAWSHSEIAAAGGGPRRRRRRPAHHAAWRWSAPSRCPRPRRARWPGPRTTPPSWWAPTTGLCTASTW